MKSLSLGKSVLIAGMLFTVGQIWLFGPKLPERVASHFGPSGEVNGWMDRSSFVMTQGILVLILGATFLGINALIRTVPSELINLPNKDYYLTPERREETLGYLCDRLLMFGAATVVLLATVYQMVYQANIRGSGTIGNTPMILVGAFLVYTLLWSIGLVRRFSAPPA